MSSDRTDTPHSAATVVNMGHRFHVYSCTVGDLLADLTSRHTWRQDTASHPLLAICSPGLGSRSPHRGLPGSLRPAGGGAVDQPVPAADRP